MTITTRALTTWARRVARAAPKMPILNTATKRMSSTTFTTVQTMST